ncbi:MAG: hypothetical protein J7498_06440 [Sphingobium sp.]|nr:hypothetical protein [Sphingobium sp.]
MPRKAPPPPSASPHDADPAPILTDTALVPVRSRSDGWTPRRQRLFIETLAETACVAAAARAAGKTPQSAWRLRRRPDAQAFSAAWEAALECGFNRLVSVALDRAINGTVRPLYYHGEQIGEERVHHDGLLMALIRNGANMLEHSRARRALRTDWDRGMAALEAGAQAPGDLSPTRYEVWDMGAFAATNCPPRPGYRGIEAGMPGTPGYWRQLEAAETAGHMIKSGRDPVAEEANRQAFFGLDTCGHRPARRGRRR